MTKPSRPALPRSDTVRIDHPSSPFTEFGEVAESPVLVSVPHSGRYYPQELLDQARLPLEQIRMLEDPLVDFLVQDVPAKNTGVIIGNYARAWIDLNRRETELDVRQITPQPAAHLDHRSPRVTAGLGLIPQISGAGRILYDKPLALDAVTERVREVHRPYHACIDARLAAMKARFGIVLLCDVHSMPPLPAAQAADIVIGDRHGRSAAMWVVNAAASWLTQHGLRVARNLPYAGGHGVDLHGQPSESRHAIQIEIDRRLYLEPGSHKLSGNAESIRRLVAELMQHLRETLESGAACELAAE